MDRIIYLGSDHAGYLMKEDLKNYLQTRSLKTIDLGCFNEDQVDYPDIAREVSDKVEHDPKSLGILVCGTGIGMMMAANKHKGIRAVDCTNELMSKMARLHNDANVLTLGSKLVDVVMAKKILDVFVDTRFEGEEAHIRQLHKMDEAYNPDDCC
jgi:ribose 5-phosphate isomerase B